MSMRHAMPSLAITLILSTLMSGLCLRQCAVPHVAARFHAFSFVALRPRTPCERGCLLLHYYYRVAQNPGHFILLSATYVQRPKQTVAITCMQLYPRTSPRGGHALGKRGRWLRIGFVHVFGTSCCVVPATSITYSTP